ncbi:MAG: alpha/beta hydrolase [Acidobacteria bacterium]|nr:alpha/beta hydrolase [Acidobacteriota bacterium]
MKLRLYHHADGARVAYREQGTGQPLILWHSELLSHRELVPLVAELEHRYRVVLPDLPLHGDSEDRPAHPYTRRWLAEVVAGFCRDVGGARPLVGGHGLGAEVVLEAIASGLLLPDKLVLMGNRLHRPGSREADWNAWLVAARAGAVPGADRVLMRAARIALRPQRGVQLSARGNPEAADVVRHALADVGGNANLARSWAAFARDRPTAPRRELLDAYGRMEMPVLLLWADEDPRHPVVGAEEALDLLPDGQLRIVPRTGYLMAWDDPVAVAREISAFCG